MAFNLGNFAVKEILYGVAQDFNGNLLYSLDQLTSAEIAVESESTDITDKNGNIIRTIYKNKTASFTATSALISPAILNAASGSDAQIASETSKLQMPKIVVVAAGGSVDISDAIEGSVHVMGIYGNGANGAVLTPTEIAAATSAGVFTAPVAAEDAPTQYLVRYERDVESGMILKNTSDQFPKTISLTLYAAIVDPCEDSYRAAYIYIPSFQPNPAVTISLDSENQEMNYEGSIQLDFCGTDKVLYYIEFPDEEAIVTGTTPESI